MKSLDHHYTTQPPLCSLTTPQPHSLAVFLEFCDQLVSLFNNIVVLLVLVIRSVGLDDPLSSHAINRAVDSFSCDKLGQVAKNY